MKRVRAASRLFVMDLASGEQTMLVDDLDPDMQETWAVQGAYPTMAWTPDGDSIVYWSKATFGVSTLPRVNRVKFRSRLMTRARLILPLKSRSMLRPTPSRPPCRGLLRKVPMAVCGL